MRTAFLIGAEYEWAHHVEYARAAGLTDEEIARIAAGPDAAGWSEEQPRRIAGRRRIAPRGLHH